MLQGEGSICSGAEGTGQSCGMLWLYNLAIPCTASTLFIFVCRSRSRECVASFRTWWTPWNLWRKRSECWRVRPYLLKLTTCGTHFMCSGSNEHSAGTCPAFGISYNHHVLSQELQILSMRFKSQQTLAYYVFRFFVLHDLALVRGSKGDWSICITAAGAEGQWRRINLRQTEVVSL